MWVVLNMWNNLLVNAPLTSRQHCKALGTARDSNGKPVKPPQVTWHSVANQPATAAADL
jgi:hypothetical protein